MTTAALFRVMFLATLTWQLCAAPLAAAQHERTPETPGQTARSASGQWRTVSVDGVDREFLLFPSSAAGAINGAPLMLVFHGHGGSARGYAEWLRMQDLWPEAVVVYLQGLPGASGRTDREGLQAGWQMRPGDLGDRDVHFVDAALLDIQRSLAIDPNAVYAFGHSNGALFVSILWNLRGETFAALGTAAGLDPRLVVNAPPRSLFIIMGENDPLVPVASQTVGAAAARRVLGTDVSAATTEGYLRVEPGVLGTVGSSRVDLQACKLEYSIVSPK